MEKTAAHTFQMTFPGDLEYIPAVRKYMADVLAANNFNPKFSYRSEIIVDEICNNAVNFGCVEINAKINLDCTIDSKRVQFEIRDEGGSSNNIIRLKKAIAGQPDSTVNDSRITPDKQLGLEIVRMISDELDCSFDGDHLTTVRVVKNREDESPADDVKSVH